MKDSTPARSSLWKNSEMKILGTERLILREMNAATDAEFIFELLSTPKFIRHIGDRGVRTVDEAVAFIDDRYLTE